MTVGLMEQPVAKQKKSQDSSIRADAETADLIKKAATLKGLTIAEYLRTSFLPIVRRDLVAEGKKLARGDKPE